MSPSPFLARYMIDWLATQTMARAEKMVVDEVKNRVETGNLGDYEGVLFKDAFRSNQQKDRIGVGGVDLGIVAASKAELVGVIDKMGTPKVTKGDAFKYYVGTWKGFRIAAVETGAGIEKARGGTEALIQVFRPKRVVCIGFAKSLVPSLKAGALFVPTFLVDDSGRSFDLTQPKLPAPQAEQDECESLERDLSDDKTPEKLSFASGADACVETCADGTTADVNAQDAATSAERSEKEEETTSNTTETADVSASNDDSDGAKANTPNESAPNENGDANTDMPRSFTGAAVVYDFLNRFATGTLVSVDQETVKSSEKKRLAEELGASALDRETFAVADVCGAAGVPFLPLRVIFDVRAQAGSKEAERAVRNEGQSMARTLGAFFGAVSKRPSAALDVYKLKEQSLEAADKLAKALGKILGIAQENG